MARLVAASTTGRKRQLRKRIAGQLRVIAVHQKKIEAELHNSTPKSPVSENGE
jgi:hypothetical protein